jgi:hypothetical protein
MNDTPKDVILTRIEGLKQQREAYIRQAEQHLAGLNGAIEVLESLLVENEVEVQPEKPARDE